MSDHKVDKIIEQLTRMEVKIAEMNLILDRNTSDIEQHIKRTNLLEKKLSKVYTAALVICGALGAEALPHLIKLIGLI